MKGRRAQGHVEMIISFVIFVGFVTTLLIVLNPIKTRPISGTLLDITQDVLLDNWTISYSTSSMVVDLNNLVTPTANCFTIPNQPGRVGGLLVIDEFGVERRAGVVGGATGDINIDKSGAKFYRLYFSNDFVSIGSPSGCSEFLSADDYTFGALVIQDDIFNKSLYDLNKSYDDDYIALKDRLGLTNDFAFTIFDADTKEILLKGERQVPPGAQVIARNIPLLVINEKTKRSSIIVNLRAW